MLWCRADCSAASQAPSGLLSAAAHRGAKLNAARRIQLQSPQPINPQSPPVVSHHNQALHCEVEGGENRSLYQRGHTLQQGYETPLKMK